MLNRTRFIFRPATARRGRAAFTLTELIAAVAIVVVLMLGVSYVFTATSDTIGVGMAMSAATRQARATQTTLAEDFERAMGMTGTEPMPSLVINSQTKNLQATAYLSKQTQDAGTLPLPGEFRTDTLSFFASGTFARQTADNDHLSSAATAPQAWIHYGHLDVANGPSTFAGPGTGTPQSNRDNFYASQWTVGRFVMLLRGDLTATTPAPDNDYIIQNAATVPMSPLAYGTPSRTGTHRIQTSRFDQAQWSADAYATGITNAGTTWWTRLTQAATAADTYRFQYDAFPMRPLTAEGAAKTVPAFIANATDFAVEFAGDFDGTPGIDVHATAPTTGPYAGVLNTIRWYGFPRDATGDGRIIMVDDVVPLRDYGPTPGFERLAPAAKPDYAVAGALPATARYVAAWAADDGLPRPSLIRITVVTADPNGRMAEPQTMQFVFNLK